MVDALNRRDERVRYQGDYRDPYDDDDQDDDERQEDRSVDDEEEEDPEEQHEDDAKEQQDERQRRRREKKIERLKEEIQNRDSPNHVIESNESKNNKDATESKSKVRCKLLTLY